MKLPLSDIAAWLGAEIEGDSSVEITGLAKIEEANAGELTFIANPKYIKYAESTNASAILVDRNLPPMNKTFVRVDNPYLAFLKLTQRFYAAEPTLRKGVHETAIIGDNSKIGKNARIGAYAVIGRECRIGDNVFIYPGVVIDDHVGVGKDSVIYANVCIRERCTLGKGVIIHMGAVIGADGFGFAFEEGAYHKIPQVGSVRIDDDVEIGANTTIDRAALGETRIGKGTKLDNLIMIAHNVEVGEHTAIAAQTGISGSARIGNYVRVGGQAGFIGHIRVGDRVIVGAQAGITKDAAPGEFLTGTPARHHIRVKREQAGAAKIPQLLKRVGQLEARLAELERKSDQGGEA